MSSHELERVAVRGRVKNGDLKLSHAAVMLDVSYRQAKRLWRRVQAEGHARRAVAGKVPFTPLGRMCEKLDIGIIAASSSQANSRIERAKECIKIG